MKLESWYTISNTQVTDDRLVVRLIPDHYNSDLVDPVITITVTQPENMQSALASLALLVDDFLIDLSVLSQSLQIFPRRVNTFQTLRMRTVYCVCN